MRLTFVIYALGSGGAERVITILANHFAERGDDVSLVTFDDGSESPFFPLDERVRLQSMGTAGACGSPIVRFRKAVARVSTLRRQLRANRPDRIVSFMDRTNMVTMAATTGMRVPVIVSERNDPSQHNAGAKADLLRTVLYRGAEKIVVQTNAAASYFRSPLNAKTVVVPNPVLAPPNGHDRHSHSGNSLVAMGRLANEKGFDLLLRAFATISGRFPAWNLTIWGEGELRGSLESLRDELGLRERVRIPGRTKDPNGELLAADIFVLSSRYEGFPNVLAEAMARGLPVVSFDCPSGPADLIEPGVNGMLAPPLNIEALADELATLMSNDSERRRLGSNAEGITKTYSLDRVMAMWESIIDNRQDSRQELS